MNTKAAQVHKISLGKKMNKKILIIAITILLLSQILVSKSQAALAPLSAANQVSLSDYIDVNNNLTWTDNANQRGENVVFLNSSVFFEFLENQGGLTLASDSAANSGLIIKNKSAVFKNVNFTGFSRTDIDARGNGAVMNISSGSHVRFDGNFSFSSGSASNFGGALFVSDSIVEFSNGRIDFSNNQAWMGGAVYLENSIMIFRAFDTNPSIYFSNISNSISRNDIYSQNASLVFDIASRRYAALTNGIRAQGSTRIIKRGAGDIIFEGDSSSISGVLDIESGRAIFRSSANFAGHVNVSESGVFSLKNNRADEFFAADFTLKGGLELDLDFSSGISSNDKIISQKAIVEDGAILTINPLNKKRWIYGKTNALISADDISYASLSYDEQIYKIHYSPSENSIILIYTADAPLDLSSLNLTHNQKQAALFLASAKGKYYRSPAESDLQNYENAYQFDILLTKVFSGDIDTELFLEEFSPSFLAQTIVETAVDDFRQNLYHKIQRANIFPYLSFEEKARENISHSAWGEVFVKDYSLENKGGSLGGKFSDSKYGALGGYTFIERYDLSLGAFGSYGKNSIKRGGNKASIENFEGGFYGGLFSDFFEHRFFLNGGYHQAETIRAIEFGRGYNPSAQFNLLSIKGGAESSMPLSNSKTIKPQLFLGLRGAVVFNDEIKEKGEEVRANIAPGSYKRISGYGGFRLKTKGWHIGAQFSSVLSGNNESSQFEANIEGFEDSLTVEGSNRDFAFYGLQGGLEQEIKSNVYLYALGEASRSRDGYERNFSASVGIKMFLHIDKDIKFYGDAMRRKRLQANLDKKRLEKERREKIALEQKLKADEERRRIEAKARETELLNLMKKEEQRLREAEQRRKAAKASYKLKAASFESGSDILSVDALENIKVLANAIKSDSYQRITVEGHTDSTGTDDLNNSLSDKRAFAVYSELIRNGIDIDKVQIVAFGSKMPIADNLTANGKAQNRRVEIFIE